MCWVREHELQPAWESAQRPPSLGGFLVLLGLPYSLWLTHLSKKLQQPSNSCFISGKGLICVLYPAYCRPSLLSSLYHLPSTTSSEEGNGTCLFSLSWKGKGLVPRSLPSRRICSWEKYLSLWKEEGINSVSLFEISFHLSFVTVQRAKAS